jgi:DeoR/GlpR family transcriptional regulator of sugar metabolism
VSAQIEGAADAAGLLAAERRSRILSRLRLGGTARVRELAQALGVSEMTIRRDLDALAATGAIEKFYGGARLLTSLSHDEPGFAAKRKRQGAEKAAIAAEAVRHVSEGMVVGLSGGTTTHAFAHALREVPGLTIVTNSIPVADQFRGGGTTTPYRGTVLITGGERTLSDALVGPIAVSSLRQLHVDLLFLGVHGADAAAGLTTPNLLESEVNQVFLSASNRVAVLADHTKWGTVGMSTFAPLAAADLFITDDGLSADACGLLTEQVGRLVVARTER